LSVDCVFHSPAAEAAGVTFRPVYEDRVEHQGWDEEACLHGWCGCPSFPAHVGWVATTPSGVSGYCIGRNFFQCKNINQELLEWFLENVPGAVLSY